MSLRLTTLFATFLVALSTYGSLAPAAPAGKKPSPPPAVTSEPEVPHYTSVRPIAEGITQATLSNGLTVLVQENHVAPVATVRCYVRNTGGAFEGKYLGAGLSHVLEHVVAGGTTTHRGEKEIERIVDTFGGATNAYTSEYMTTFFIDCPARNTLSAIELVADSMQHVKFEASEFERELQVVRRELADDEVERGHVLSQLLDLTLYTQSPARHPVIGYLDVLKRTSNQAIIDFYRERYVPNNQIFVVVGDVKTQDVLDQVAKQWTGTPRGRETYVPMPDEPEQIAPREAYREMEGATVELALAWPSIKLSHPDLYALDVAAAILGDGESSRLVRHLKYDRPLVLSISAASYTPHFVKGWFGVMASATPEHWKEADQEILREVYQLASELVNPEELAKVKKQKEAELVMSRQTVQEEAESLGRSLLTADDPLFDQAYVKNIEKVTAEQVQDVARRYLVPNRLNRVVIAPPGSAAKTTVATTAAADREIREVKLPNGLRVLVKRYANLPLVNVQVYALGGSLADTPETAGRAGLVGAMLDQGTDAHSAEQIAEYFDSIGGKFVTTAGRNTVYASMTVMRDDFPKATALFAECVNRPAFAKESFERMKELNLGAIARRSDDPQHEAMELFFDNLPATSPYHLLQEGKKETIEPLKAEDLRAFHAKYFVPNNMIVTVFGDIEPDAALAVVRENFGGLKPAADFKPVSFARDNALAQSIVKHKQTGKDTGMIVLGYPAMSIFDKEDYAALTMLEAVMAGYMYPGGWLHNELRGAGLVYYVQATPLTGPAPGYFIILSQSQPDKIDEVVSRIQKNVAKAKAGEITADEFDTARQRVLAMHAQENTTIASQAQQAAPNVLFGLGYDYDKTFDARIQAVTLADMTRVARKYFNNYVLVTTSPRAPVKPAGQAAAGRAAH